MGHKFAKGLSFLLSLILIVTSLNLGAPVQAAGDGQTTDNETTKVYEGDGYQATYTLLATWEGGSNFQIEIKNTGDKTIENWSILVEYQDEINNIWNAEIVKKEDNKYTIKNAGWNQDILVGQSICFGMSASSAFTAVPASITLLDNFTAVKTEGIELGYTLSSSWDNGCTGNITVSMLLE